MIWATFLQQVCMAAVFNETSSWCISCVFQLVFVSFMCVQCIALYFLLFCPLMVCLLAVARCLITRKMTPKDRRNIHNRKGLVMMQTWRDTDEKLRDVGRGGNVLDTYQSGYPCNNLSSLSAATYPQGISLACSQ